MYDWLSGSGYLTFTLSKYHDKNIGIYLESVNVNGLYSNNFVY